MLSDKELRDEAIFQHKQSLKDGNNQSYGKQNTQRSDAVAIDNRFIGLKLENLVHDCLSLEYNPAKNRQQYRTGKPDIEIGNKKGEIRTVSRLGVVPIRKSDRRIMDRYLILGNVNQIYGFMLIRDAISIADAHPEYLSNPYGGNPAHFVPLNKLPLKPLSEFLK